MPTGGRKPTSVSLSEVLEGLLKTGVDFILVGGLAAVVQGAPVTTMDVDIVHSRSPENVARLLAFLKSFDAVHPVRVYLLIYGIIPSPSLLHSTISITSSSAPCIAVAMLRIFPGLLRQFPIPSMCPMKDRYYDCFRPWNRFSTEPH